MLHQNKKTLGAIFLFAFMLIFANLFSRAPWPEGSVSARDIVSYCSGDATNDGIPELLVLSGRGKIDTGERHGEFLLLCDASAKADMDSLGYIPPDKIRHRIDLTAIKPLKVQLGDINGDGVNEVAICVYKTAKFHTVMAKRPFFFDLVQGNLIPVWLGSRLSRPFDDYILYDIDADAIDEIISVERLENGNRVIAAYNWRGFGFEMLVQSEEFNGKLLFDPDEAGQSTESGEIAAIFFQNEEYTRLRFRLYKGKLVYE